MVLLSQNVAILDHLRAAQSYTAQSQALRSLKNETVGHVMKKEKWVELGVLRPVVKVLLPERPSNWLTGDGRGDRREARDRSHNRQPSAVTPPDNLPADDLARLQALELLGIFASGGPTFLAPLHAAGALPAILEYIDPNSTHPRLVYAALRSLVTITKSARLVSVPVSSPAPITIASLADTVLATPRLQAFYNIIIAAPRAWWTESITNAAMSLISPLCCDVRHQVSLAQAGILDALAVKVASYVVARGQVVPGADIAAEKEGLRDAIPAPATPLLDISAVFDAIAAIMGNSRLRTGMLLYAPSILAIFPQIEFESSVNDIHAAWRALSMGGLTNFDQQSLGALDFLLPAVPSQQSRAHLSHNSPFPPLGMGLSREHLPRLAFEEASGKRGLTQQQQFSWGSSAASSQGASGAWNPAGLIPEGHGEEPESPMVPWLFSLVRSTTGLERLMAASVLTSIYKAGFSIKSSREAAMAFLIIPLLLRMLDNAANTASNSASGEGRNKAASGSSQGNHDTNDGNAEASQQATTEAALTVLARLIANSDVLQKAAVDGNAIKILAKLLKSSYEPVSLRSSPRPWNPTPTSSANPTRTGTPIAAIYQGGSGSGSRSFSGEDRMEDTAAGGLDSDDPDSPFMMAVSSKLGPAGQNHLLAYRIRLREAVLKALTALLATKYDYQKAFVDQEAMIYVVASLNPTPSKPRSSKEKTKTIKEMVANGTDGSEFDPEYGRNPVGVLVAACNCIRMMSRSIAILRTTLEDAGVAAPIFRLLNHPDTEVQIAATGVVCNLVTETSPMRERYAEAGVMNILCSHAHSQNSPLRLNSLWALKHFVDGVEPSMKKACLEQLGSGWLVRLIDPDVESDSSSVFFAHADGNKSAASAGTIAGVAVDDGMDEDVEMGQSDGGEDDDGNEGHDGAVNSSTAAGKTPSWAAPATIPTSAGSPSFQRAKYPRTSHERSRTGRLRQAEAKIAALREVELNTQRKSQNDDVAIQEQGLNFIRNLIGPGSFSPVPSSAQPPSTTAPRDPANEATEMIDYLFNEIGQERLFAILLSKIKPRVRASRFSTRLANRPASAAGTPGGASASPGSSAASGAAASLAAGGSSLPDPTPRLQQPRAKIIEAVVFILVHISASVARHRQQVITQTELLKALIGQFMSRDKGVRVALCHLVTNLTWRDDMADTQAAMARATELKRLGIMPQLEALQAEDAELDVREQAKMAVHQMGAGQAVQ